MIRRILIFCLLIMLASLGATAKKLSVERFGQLATDISARVNQREDLNGEKCALIKVLLPVEGCRFEGNIGDTKFDVNEYWVYVSPGTRRIKVKCPGFATLEVDFGSYSDISRVEPMLTYGLVITDYDQPDIIQNPDGNMLSLEVVPAGNGDITVMINGKQQQVENGKVTAFLRSGKHTYSVEAPGYIASNGEFTVTKDKGANVKVKLKSEEDMKKRQITRVKSTDIYDDIYGDSFTSAKSSSKELTGLQKTSSSFTPRYRGNIELWGGVNSCKYDLGNDTGIENVSPVFGVSTTHGCQLLPYLFVGAGVGVYIPTMWANSYYDSDTGIELYDSRAVALDTHSETWSAYCCMLPVFLDLKLELDVRRKVSPFLDVKVGYQFSSILNKNRVTSNKHTSYLVRPEDGFYFHPSIGVRVRVSEKCGINFGVSYDADIKRKLVSSSTSYAERMGPVGETVLSSMNCQAFGVTVGFDF